MGFRNVALFALLFMFAAAPSGVSRAYGAEAARAPSTLDCVLRSIGIGRQAAVDVEDAEPGSFAELEDAAVSAMKSTLPKSIAQSKQMVEDWFGKIEAHQNAGQPLSIMEHTALTFMLRNDVFVGLHDEALIARMREALRKSWVHFTGEEPYSKLLSRLDNSVLKRYGNRDEILFHQAVFHDGPLGFLGSVKMIAKDHIWTWQDGIDSMVLAASLFSHTGSSALAGMANGYALSSTVEFMVHRYMGHATQEEIEAWKTGMVHTIGMDESFTNFNAIHTAHHSAYGGDYTHAFAPPEPASGVPLTPEQYEAAKARKKAQIDAYLFKLGGQKLLDTARDTDYGRSARFWQTLLYYSPFSALSTAAVHVGAHLVGLHPNMMFDGTFFASTELWILFGAKFHPYLHMTKQEVSENGGPLMEWLLHQSPFRGPLRWIARSHRTHHKMAGMVNQNLNPGFDLISGWQPYGVEELIDLRQKGAYY